MSRKPVRVRSNIDIDPLREQKTRKFLTTSAFPSEPSRNLAISAPDAPGVSTSHLGGTEHSNQQQVEVGEHRVLPRSTVRRGTADFDLTAAGLYRPSATSAVELLI
jgi:hypothetical protein